jgi:glycine/D-amino acid oxidase-like deaminating enzyme
MSSIVVIGGGMCGSLASMMLARDGHDVVTLERDPAPEDAWDE